MVDIALARKADEVLRSADLGRTYHVWANYMRESQVFDGVHGRVIYVGCGTEFSSLFLFEGAETYIHQDLIDHHLPPAMECLARSGIVSDLSIRSDEDFKRRYSFRYKGRPKELVEVHGGEPEPDYYETYGTNGDIAFNIPDEAKEGLGAIYFCGMPYDESIRCMQINLLPYLRLGGVFEGPYPCGKANTPPHQLGLSRSEGTYVKFTHLTSEDIQRIIGYSIDDYTDELMRILEHGYSVNIHPKMRQENKTKREKKTAMGSRIVPHFIR